MSDEDLKNDSELQELLKNTSRGGRERTRRKCTIEKKEEKVVKTKVVLEVAKKTSSSRSNSQDDKNDKTTKKTPKSRAKSTSNSRAKSSSSKSTTKSKTLKISAPKTPRSSKSDAKSKKSVAGKGTGKLTAGKTRTKSPSKIKLTPKKRKTKKEEQTPGHSKDGTSPPKKKKKKSENIVYKDEADMSEDSSEFDNSEDEWGRIQKEETSSRKISADDFHISSQSSRGSQLEPFEARDDSSDTESEMQEPSLNELMPALSQFAHSNPPDSREQNERQDFQFDEGNDEMIELQLVGNSENGNNSDISKPRRTMFRGQGNVDEDTEPATQEQIETEWQDVEIQKLTEGLEYVRKAGGSLGLYGLSDQQANVIQKKFIPSKTIKQIKRN